MSDANKVMLLEQQLGIAQNNERLAKEETAAVRAEFKKWWDKQQNDAAESVKDDESMSERNAVLFAECSRAGKEIANLKTQLAAAQHIIECQDAKIRSLRSRPRHHRKNANKLLARHPELDMSCD